MKPLLFLALIFGLIICSLAYYEVENFGHTTIPLHWLGVTFCFLVVYLILVKNGKTHK